MKKFLLALSLALFTCSACADDWKGMLGKLNNMPNSASVRKRKAICCNNLAIEARQRKDWNDAESWIKEAIRYDKDAGYEKVAATIFMGRAIEAFKERKSKHFTGYMHRQAKLLAQRAITFDPKRADAYLFIGDIEYENQKLEAAEKAWLKARKIAPHLQGIDARLKRVRKESKVEKQFSKSSNSFFVVRYQDSNVDAETAAGLRLAMTTARQQVGRDFNYRPKHKLNVLVYSTRTFAGLRIGPHWAGGLYDGKIRLPLDGKKNLKYAVATLFHEYTHAIIHDLSGGNCPRWLNEGLSEIQGFKIQKEESKALDLAAEKGFLLPIHLLSSSFGSDDTAIVVLAYQQSHSIARFLVDQFGYKRIRRMLESIDRGVPFEMTLRRVCGLSSQELEIKWRESLEEQRGA